MYKINFHDVVMYNLSYIIKERGSYSSTEECDEKGIWYGVAKYCIKITPSMMIYNHDFLMLWVCVNLDSGESGSTIVLGKEFTNNPTIVTKQIAHNIIYKLNKFYKEINYQENAF